MRKIVLLALVGFSMAACVSRTVEEKPVVVQQPAQPTNTVIVPQGSTVTCAPGTAC